VDKILQVQISRHGGDDFVRWPLTKNGMYSMMSAYNLVHSKNFFISQSKLGGGMSSAAVDEERQWKRLWKIQAPGK
jgi:hypothetical protein